MILSFLFLFFYLTLIHFYFSSSKKFDSYTSVYATKWNKHHLAQVHVVTDDKIRVIQ